MEIALTKMSPNGQVVIPAEIRRNAKLAPATKFIVTNKGRTIILKRISNKDFKKDYELVEKILRSEEQIRNKEYVSADTSMSFEEVDRLLRS